MARDLAVASPCGLLVINKPRGMVSKDVSRWLGKRLGKGVKMGHVGTLDPAAEGVLPLLLGKATRLQDMLLEQPKTYECEVALGYETDSLDSDGQVIRQSPWQHVSKEALQAAAQSMQGRREQTPPLYSAVKYQGQALYAYARKGEGEKVDFAPLKRQVDIYACELLDFCEGRFSLRLSCSKGTYVRVVAQEIAAAVGSCATVVRLKRTETAGLNLTMAYSLEELDAAWQEKPASSWFHNYVLPLESLPLKLPRLQIANEGAINRLFSGQPLQVSYRTINDPHECLDGHNLNLRAPHKEESILLLDASGRVFGLGTGRWHGRDYVQVGIKRSLL